MPSSSFFRNRKVLVTGGAGLIGSGFVAELLRQGALVRTVLHRRPLPEGPAFGDDLPSSAEVEILEGDLKNFDFAREACWNVDAVVHAAAVSGGSKQVSRDPIPMFTESLWLNTVMLEAARAEKVPRYLFVSNSSVYPRGDAILREDEAEIGPPENETGEVKRVGEAQCAIYARSTDMKIAIIRAGNAYGPWDNFDLDSSHVVPATIRKAVDGNGPMVLWGDGTPVRDFIHTRDIARGGLHLLEHHAVARPVNIATGRLVSIKELARLVLVAAGRADVPIECTGTSPPASAAKRLDLERMLALGFAPELSLEEGLARTVAWYKHRRRTEA